MNRKELFEELDAIFDKYGYEVSHEPVAKGSELISLKAIPKGGRIRDCNECHGPINIDKEPYGSISGGRNTVYYHPQCCEKVEERQRLAKEVRENERKEAARLVNKIRAWLKNKKD